MEEKKEIRNANVNMDENMFKIIQTRGIPKEEFSIKGLKIGDKNPAIQSIAFDPVDKNIIYTTQAIGMTTYLSKCEIVGNTANKKSMMVLNGYGHGESLEITRNGEQVYAWLGSAYEKSESNKWSTTISRVIYDESVKNADGTINPKEEIVLKDLLYAQSSHTPLVNGGKVWRTAVAIYGDRIFFWIRLKGDGSYYSVFSLNDLNASISKYAKKVSGNRKDYSLKSSDISLKTKAKFKYQDSNDPSPDRVFQGMDVIKEEKWYMLIGGGKTPDNPSAINIYTCNGSSMSSLLKTVTLYESNYTAPVKREMESLKIMDNKVYFNILPGYKIYSIYKPDLP